jgi:hypothetical protein
MWLHASLKSSPELEDMFGFKGLFRGGYIGSIQLTAVVPITMERWLQWRDQHLDAGDYRGGLFAWIMNAPVRFHMPVPGKGQLSLFYPPIDVVQQLRRSEAAPASGE